MLSSKDGRSTISRGYQGVSNSLLKTLNSAFSIEPVGDEINTPSLPARTSSDLLYFSDLNSITIDSGNNLYPSLTFTLIETSSPLATLILSS